MKQPFLNKALLWKERRQHRWIFALVFFFLSLSPALFYFLNWLMYWFKPELFPDNWRGMASESFLLSTFAVAGNIGTILIVLMGASLLSEERTANTLEFLFSVPVGRKDIIKSKFAFGAGVIAVSAVCNTIMLSGAALALSETGIILTGLLALSISASVLLAIFSLSFFVSTITGTRGGSFAGALLFLFGPPLAAAFLNKILASFGFIPWGDSPFARLSHTVAKYVSLPQYLTALEQKITDPTKIIWIVPVMLLLSYVVYRLSLFFFERYQVERNGRILLFGNFPTLLRSVGSFLIALTATAIVSEGAKPGAFVLLLVFFGVFAVGWGLFTFINMLTRKFSLK